MSHFHLGDTLSSASHAGDCLYGVLSVPVLLLSILLSGTSLEIKCPLSFQPERLHIFFFWIVTLLLDNLFVV